MKIEDKINLLMKELTKLDDKKALIRQELTELYKHCPHSQKRPVFIETLAFERTPKMECKFCGNYTEASEAEIKAMYKEELEDLYEKELSSEELEAFYQKNPRGYNY